MILIVIKGGRSVVGAFILVVNGATLWVLLKLLYGYIHVWWFF
jgi:hypothetical protein